MARAIGTGYFIATCAAIAPQRTYCCTALGSIAFVWPEAAYGCYIFVAVMWLLPDRRIEKPAARP